jgi:drug/metabolite transporter (DMT)-like permease
MTLLLWLLRRGSTTATTSLLYLVPPVTALLAVPVLGQHVAPTVLVALGLSAAGVALTTRATAGASLRPWPLLRGRRPSGSSAR